MQKFSKAMFWMACITIAGLAARPVLADDEKPGPQPGWYIAAPERAGAPSLAFKLEKRGAVFGVAGVLGNPANTKSQVSFGGTFHPSTNKLSAKWTQIIGTKKTKLPIDGTYDAAKDAFDVKVPFITPAGPGSYTFRCIRSKTKEKETDLTGTWKTADGWTLRLTQKGDVVTGNYSGGEGELKLTGTLSTKKSGNSLAGSFTTRMGDETYRGSVQAAIVDENTIEGVWTEKETGVSQKVTATRQ